MCFPMRDHENNRKGAGGGDEGKRERKNIPG